MEIQFNYIKNAIKEFKRKILKKGLIMLVGILVICIVFFGLALSNRHKISRGLKIADISIGNSTPETAKIKIDGQVEKFLKKDIILKYKKENIIWAVKPEELGIIIDVNATLNRALKIGHQKNIISKSFQQALAFFGYYNIHLNYRIDEITFENFIKEKLDSINKPAVNAGWQYDKKSKSFTAVASQEGVIVDKGKLKLQLQKKAETLNKDDVSLNIIHDHPEVLESGTKDALIKAKEILTNAPYKLIVDDSLKISPSQFTLTKEEMIAMIEFKPVQDKNNPKNKVLGITLNREALDKYLADISLLISRPPVNAKLTIEEGKVINFALSQNGVELEVEKSISKIREEILSSPADKANKESKNINLEISIIPPKIYTKDIDNLGLTALLGKGVSNFSGSPKNRIHNINVGAAKFNGILIKPNEEFSFNTLLGEVEPEQGYKAELVIKKDKTIPEYGGGLCQVSTTVFRAAVYAGLPIKERQAHAFPVKYYNPQGFDATIYPPHPDLRFVNDTPGYLLIQTKIKGQELIFELYGTSDGCKVELEGPVQYDIREDGSMRAKLTRRIFDKDGNFIRESVFNSNYNSPALYPVERNPLE